MQWNWKNFYFQNPLCVVSIRNPIFFPCLQTVIYHELAMVWRVNQAWGGGVEGGGGGTVRDTSLCWASGLSPPWLYCALPTECPPGQISYWSCISCCCKLTLLSKNETNLNHSKKGFNGISNLSVRSFEYTTHSLGSVMCCRNQDKCLNEGGGVLQNGLLLGTARAKMVSQEEDQAQQANTEILGFKIRRLFESLLSWVPLHMRSIWLLALNAEWLSWKCTLSLAYAYTLLLVSSQTNDTCRGKPISWPGIRKCC